MINPKSRWGKKVLTAALVVLFFTAFSAAVVSAAPNCTLTYICPPDIEANSTGPFTACINCTDPAGINISRYLITKTVEGGLDWGPPNRWSIRPPANNWAQSDSVITEQILRSYNRGKGKWFDFYGIFTDNFSYGVHDGTAIHVNITNGSTWAELNYTWTVETTAFRNMFFLVRTALEAEDKANKKEYNVYADNPLLVKFWDLEHMRGTSNYTVCNFKNINYTGNPDHELKAYYCNSSYKTVSEELPNYGVSDDTANMTGNVLLMHLNETNGTIVDYSGEGHNGTAYNGVTYGADGKLGTALRFDGTNDYVALDMHYDAVGEIPELTVCCWFNTIFGGSSWTSNWALVDFDRSENYNLFVYGDNGGELGFATTATTSSGRTIKDMRGNTPVNDGEWHFGCVVFNSSEVNDKKIYLDGVLDAQQNAYSTGTKLGTGKTRYGFIGDGSEATTFNGNRNNRHYEGLIDEVAIYNRSLNADEILDLYKRGVRKPSEDTDNCVYLESFNATDLGKIEYMSRNSSYSKSCFGVNNRKIGGIDTTDTFYIGFETASTAGKYTVRYANGSSGTNVSFNDSKVAWSSTDDAVTWTQAEFTPDIWYSTIKDGDLFQLGVYVENTTGANYTNFSLHTDEIGDVNWPISKPNIEYYQSAGGGTDEYLNGTHSGNMTIRVNVAKDPDGVGTVKHNLTLRNTDGSWYYTINGSFNSSDDSDVDMVFDTRNILNGLYKMNVTAIADDKSSDVQSYLTSNNFTIGNPTYVNETGWWRCGAAFNPSATPIMAAVENATSGEAIYVFNGSYENESVNVDKTHLTLQGESVDGVNVTAAASSDHVFNVTADWVNISGFTVTGATGNGKTGIYLNGADHCNIFENNATNDSYGISLNSSSNNTLTSNTASNNTDCDFYSDESSHDNVIEYLTISSYPTTISFTYDNGVCIKGVKTAPPDPDGKANISKYVNATNVTANSWLFLNVSYSDSDLSDGMNEDSLKLYHWNGATWEYITDSGVDTEESYVYGNLTEFSIFAPLGDDPAVTTIPTATGTGNVTITTSSGYFCDETAALGAADFPSLPGSTVTFHHGFFNLTICGLNTSNPENVTINFTFPSAIPTNAEFWKYNSSNETWYPYPFDSNDGDNVISITIADNGAGDHNPAPGVINDPNGIGWWTAAGVPALTPIGMIALICILSVVLATATKRRRK